MTRNSVSRFQITVQPQALPSSCAVCGIGAGPVDGKEIEFADFGLSYEWYGAFYLCERCVFELADCFDCTSPANTKAMQYKIDQLTEQLEKSTAKLKEVENALGNSLIAGLSVTVDSSGNVLHGTLNETNSSKSTNSQ